MAKSYIINVPSIIVAGKEMKHGESCKGISQGTLLRMLALGQVVEGKPKVKKPEPSEEPDTKEKE